MTSGLSGCKMLLVIDTLGSGGAQRQISELAVLMVDAGVDVTVLAYYRNSFYVSYLLSRGVKVLLPDTDLGQFARLAYVWKGVAEVRPDVVCAFLTAPSLAVELGRVFLPFRYRLIVSERHADSQSSWSTVVRFVFHRLADAVVANSETQRAFIQSNASWLRDRLFCIRNYVDLDRFSPVNKVVCDPGRLRILVLASYTRNKNTLGLLKGLRCLLDRRPNLVVSLVWHGNKVVVDGGEGGTDSPFQEAFSALKELELAEYVSLQSQRGDTEQLYKEVDLFCLPSLSEATPNVICEAMASGLPVVASHVGDIPDFVEAGVNGYLFNPSDPVSISLAIEEFVDLDAESKERMSRSNREKAELLFSKDRFVREYSEVIHLR